MSEILWTASAKRREFVFHLPTGQIGIVLEIWRSGVESCQTVRLAGGEMICAPTCDFRPATVMEIAERHRAAALQRPLTLPAAAGFHRHAS